MTHYKECLYYGSWDNFIGCPVTKRWVYPQTGSPCIQCPFSRRMIKITKEEQTENLQWASDSFRVAYTLGIVQCRGCWEWFDLSGLYRCFHCASYFCSICSQKHFGKHPRTIVVEGDRNGNDQGHNPVNK